MAMLELLDCVVMDDKKYYGPPATMQNGFDYTHYESLGLEYGGDKVSDSLFSAKSLQYMLDNNQVVKAKESAKEFAKEPVKESAK